MSARRISRCSSTAASWTRKNCPSSAPRAAKRYATSKKEIRFDDGTSRYLLGNATPLRDAEGNPCGAVAAFVDITDRKKAEEQRDLLVAELSHRVKNTLAIVISIAQQSFSRNPNAEEARRSFDSRIRALAQTHSRLAEANWSGVSFQAMLLDELAPYFRDDGRNITVSGPPIALHAKCALTLGMALHELATNAAKHGALSSKSARSMSPGRSTPATGSFGYAGARPAVRP